MPRRVISLRGAEWYGVPFGAILTAEQIRKAKEAHGGRRPPKRSTAHVPAEAVRKAHAAPRPTRPPLAALLPPPKAPTISGTQRLRFDVVSYGVPRDARVAEGPELTRGRVSFWVMDALGIVHLLHERRLSHEVRVLEWAVPPSVAAEVRATVFRN